jgi:L-arabinokinase
MRYRIIGSDESRKQASAFLDILDQARESVSERLAGFLAGPDPVYLSRAPGRLDVMGGIADYSGALVLQLPIAEATYCAIQLRDDRRLRLAGIDQSLEALRTAVIDIDRFHVGGDLRDCERAAGYFEGDWRAYVAGVFTVLAAMRDARFDRGADLLIWSQVPEAKGVSSSAAVEVAVMQAVVRAFGPAIEPRDMALLCQQVENRVVGAPCGIMDQMTSVCGRADELLALRCQPAELQQPLPLPDSVRIWGIDSGERHAVSGADYGTVRTAAFMGYRIILEQLRPQAANDPTADPMTRGYLANLSPSVLSMVIEHLLPRMSGREFIAAYGQTSDTVTRVDPDRHYPVRAATAHPVMEQHRIETFAALLPLAVDAAVACRLCCMRAGITGHAAHR